VDSQSLPARDLHPVGRNKEFPIRLSFRYLPLLPGFAWRNQAMIKALRAGRIVVTVTAVPRGAKTQVDGLAEQVEVTHREPFAGTIGLCCPFATAVASGSDLGADQLHLNVSVAVFKGLFDPRLGQIES